MKRNVRILTMVIFLSQFNEVLTSEVNVTQTDPEMFLISRPPGNSTIYRLKLPPASYPEVVWENDFASALDYDQYHQTVFFWGKMGLVSVKTDKAFLQEEHIVYNESCMYDIAVDWIHNNVYWIHCGNSRALSNAMIKVVNIHSQYCHNVVSKYEGIVSGLAVDPRDEQGWLYWSSAAGLHRAGLDGSHNQTIIQISIVTDKSMTGIVVDYIGNRLYWTEFNLFYQPAHTRIRSSDLQGQNKLTVTEFAGTCYELSIFNTWIFWLDTNVNVVKKTNKTHGGIQYKVVEGLSHLEDFKIAHPSQQPLATNQCADNNGQCSYLCLRAPKLNISTPQHTCKCPEYIQNCSVCNHGYFGSGCQHRCHCQNNASCDHINHACPYGCNPGWRGKSCSMECQDGYFGVNCTSRCPCPRKMKCHHVNGTCLLGECFAGRTGKHCAESCPSGYYGGNCALKCQHCQENVPLCDDVSGFCRRGCQPGWSGNTCSLEIDECISQPCQHGGTCSDHVSSYTCSCPIGITGINCEINLITLVTPIVGTITIISIIVVFICRFKFIKCFTNFGKRFQTESQSIFTRDSNMGYDGENIYQDIVLLDNMYAYAYSGKKIKPYSKSGTRKVSDKRNAQNLCEEVSYSHYDAETRGSSHSTTKAGSQCQTPLQNSSNIPCLEDADGCSSKIGIATNECEPEVFPNNPDDERNSQVQHGESIYMKMGPGGHVPDFRRPAVIYKNIPTFQIEDQRSEGDYVLQGETQESPANYNVHHLYMNICQEDKAGQADVCHDQAAFKVHLLGQGEQTTF